MLTDRELQSLRNMGNEAESAADEIERLRCALLPLANAHTPSERELLTDADVDAAQAALYGTTPAPPPATPEG